MSDDMVEKARAFTAKYLAQFPSCSGYPECDGDLEQEHSEKCPLHGNQEHCVGPIELAAEFARSAVRDAVREIVKEQEKRAEELEQDAGFYHYLGDAHEAIARRYRAQERRFVASALREKFNIEKE